MGVLLSHHICLGWRASHHRSHSLGCCIEALRAEHDGSWSPGYVQKAWYICSWDRSTVGLGGPCVLMKVGPRARGKVGGGGGGPRVKMGAGGDGPCLVSWLLRCPETLLSKWN